MSLERRKAPRRTPKTIASVFIIVDGMLLLAALWSVLVKPNVDFPCGSGPGPAPEAALGTQISYCITLWPRWASGGEVYASGSTDKNRVTLAPRGTMYPGITIERESEALVVNGERLALGQAFTASSWMPSLNPWLILTARIRLASLSSAKDILFVEGEITEGWLPGPIGPLVLVLASWMLIRAHRHSRHGA